MFDKETLIALQESESIRTANISIEAACCTSAGVVALPENFNLLDVERVAA